MKITDETIRTSLRSETRAPQKANLKLYSEFSAYRSKRSRLTYAAIIGIPAATVLLGAGVYTIHNGGYFHDVKNGFGTITGVTYENATDEISIKAVRKSEQIELTVQILEPYINKMPYEDCEQLKIGKCTLISKGKNTDFSTDEISEVENGKAVFILDIADADSISITELISRKKADADLSIYGNWEIPLE